MAQMVRDCAEWLQCTVRSIYQAAGQRTLAIYTTTWGGGGGGGPLAQEVAVGGLGAALSGVAGPGSEHDEHGPNETMMSTCATSVSLDVTALALPVRLGRTLPTLL